MLKSIIFILDEYYSDLPKHNLQKSTWIDLSCCCKFYVQCVDVHFEMLNLKIKDNTSLIPDSTVMFYF